MMMVGLAHLTSQVSLLFTKSNVQATRAFINSIVAGLGGAIGCLIAFKIVVFIRLRYEDAILQFANKDDEKRKKQFVQN